MGFYFPLTENVGVIEPVNNGTRKVLKPKAWKVSLGRWIPNLYFKSTNESAISLSVTRKKLKDNQFRWVYVDYMVQLWYTCDFSFSYNNLEPVLAKQLC